MNSDARERLATAARKCYERGLIFAKNGNLTLRTDEGNILTIPMGICLGNLSPGDIILTNIEGKILEQSRYLPSIEFYNLHLPVLSARQDIMGIVHTHSPSIIALSTLKISSIGPISTEMALGPGTIPVAEYHNPFEPDFFKSIQDLILNYDSIILKNHGLIAVGKTIEDAYYLAELSENYAYIYILALKAGGPDLLSTYQVQSLIKSKEKILTPKKHETCQQCGMCEKR